MTPPTPSPGRGVGGSGDALGPRLLQPFRGCREVDLFSWPLLLHAHWVWEVRACGLDPSRPHSGYTSQVKSQDPSELPPAHLNNGKKNPALSHAVALRFKEACILSLF